jgi:hypothetical protein
MAAPKIPAETALWKAAESDSGEGVGVAEGKVPLVLFGMSVFAELNEPQACRGSVPVDGVLGSSGGHEGSESEGNELELHYDWCWGYCEVWW